MVFKRDINLFENASADEVLKLWRSEKLLSPTRDPLGKSDDRQSFRDLVLSNTRRVNVRRIFLS